MSCFTKYCKGIPKGNRKHCEKCRKRKQRSKNTLLATYMSLKHNAKRRGVLFKLTLKEFKDFCDSTGYLKKKGVESEDMSIDRIKAWEGYHKDNIQMLTVAENGRKGSKERKTAPHAKYVYDPDSGDPF